MGDGCRQPETAHGPVSGHVAFIWNIARAYCSIIVECTIAFSSVPSVPRYLNDARGNTFQINAAPKQRP